VKKTCFLNVFLIWKSMFLTSMVFVRAIQFPRCSTDCEASADLYWLLRASASNNSLAHLPGYVWWCFICRLSPREYRELCMPAVRRRVTFVDRLILAATQVVHARLCGPDRRGKYPHHTALLTELGHRDCPTVAVLLLISRCVI